MATQADVRRIALSFPGAEESKTDFAFSVPNKGKLKGFAWCWKERIDPKKARVPNYAVLAVRVANLGHKEAMLSADPEKFFTEPHYNGYPAVLVRLAAIKVAELRPLLEDAWRTMAPKELGGTGKPPAKGPRSLRARKKPSR
jgi:hypothetical protein